MGRDHFSDGPGKTPGRGPQNGPGQGLHNSSAGGSARGAGLGGSAGAGRVVTLADFDRRISHRTLTELRAYWNGLQRGRAVPDRADVDPRAIERTLEYAFILERVAPGHARFRIAGTHLNDLMGMEVRGMPLAAFFAPEAREMLQDALEQVFALPEILELTLAGDDGFGRPPLVGRMLLMPLKSDLGDITRVLGCLIGEGQIGRTPRRFTITEAEASAVIPGAPTGPRLIPDSGAAQPARAPAPEPEMAPVISSQPEEPAATAAPDDRPDDTPEARRARFKIVR